MTKLIWTLLVLAIIVAGVGDARAQDRSEGRNVLVAGDRGVSEPNLSIELDPPPPYSRRPGQQDAPIAITYGDRVDTSEKPDLLVDPPVINAEFNGPNYTQLKLTLPANVKVLGKRVVSVTLTVKGPDGRRNYKHFAVYVDSGALLGEIVTDSVADGKQQTDTHRIVGMKYFDTRFEGSIFFIDENSNGVWDSGEPSTVVDAKNQFRFPQSRSFFREDLIRPSALWVSGKNEVIPEGAYGDFLVDLKKKWFQISGVPVNEIVNPARVIVPMPAPAEPAPAEPVPEEPVPQNGAVAEAESTEGEKALRVKSDSTDEPRDGTSWKKAFRSLDEAIAEATLTRNQIWIAQGTYRPATRNTGFLLRSDVPVSLFGGFLGTDDETKVADRPGIRRGTTILSGDIKQDDGHFAPVTSVAASMDRELIVTASVDRSVKLWKKNGEKYDLVRTFVGHVQDVRSVAISPSKDFVVSGGDDMTLRIWKTDGTPLKVIPPDSTMLKGHSGGIRSVAISSDNLQLASGAADGTVRLWDAGSFSQLKRWTGHAGDVTCVAFMGTQVVSGGRDRTVRIWDVNASDAVQVLDEHTGAVTSLSPVAGSPARIVSGSEDSSLLVWRQSERDDRFNLQHRLQGEPFKLSLRTTTTMPDKGSGLAVLAKMGNELHLRLFDGRGLQVISDEKFDADETLQLESAVGDRWDTGQLSAEDRTTISSVLEPMIGRPLHDDFGMVKTLAVSGDSTTVVASHVARHEPQFGNSMSFWNLETGRLELANSIKADEFPATITLMPRDVSVPKYNFSVVGGREKGGVYLQNRSTQLQKFADHDAVLCAAISRDGKLTASGGNDGKIRVKDRNGNVAMSIDHTKPVTAIAFNHDGTQLAFGSEGKLLLAAIGMAPAPTSTDAHDGAISSIAFSNDGKRIVTGGTDRIIQVWKADDGTKVHSFSGHVGPVHCLGIVGTEDACRIVSGSADRTLRVWDLTSGELVDTIQYDAPILACSIQGTINDLQIAVGVDRVEFEAVRFKTDSPSTLNGIPTFNGGMAAVKDRVLVVAQDASHRAQNGIYIVDSGQWIRASDADEPGEFLNGKRVAVKDGNGDTVQEVTYGGVSSPALEVDEIAFTDEFEPVHYKSDTNQAMLRGTLQIDREPTAVSQRVLVVGQDDPKQNGIYVVQAGDWTRATDANGPEDFITGKLVRVRKGRLYAGTVDVYAGPNAADPTMGQLLFSERNDLPAVHVLNWTQRSESAPTVTRSADLSSRVVITHLAMANDGRTVVGGSTDGKVRRWEMDADGQLGLVKTIDANSEAVTAVGIAGDGGDFISATGTDLNTWGNQFETPPAITLAPFNRTGPQQIGDNALAVVTVPANAKGIKLDGVVLQGGTATDSGGGLLVNAGSTVTVSDCIIEGNAGITGGGASVVDDGTVAVEFKGTYFAWNSADTEGGGIITKGPTTFDSCIFHANRALVAGGAVRVEQSPVVKFDRCTIHACESGAGSAVRNTKGKMEIRNSAITNNRVTTPGGFALQCDAPEGVSLFSTIIAGNFVGMDSKAADFAGGVVIATSELNVFGPGVKIADPANETNLFNSPVEELIPTPWLAYQSTSTKVNYRFPPTLSLPEGELFEGFGDFGGNHPTVGLSSESVARERGSSNDTARADQRGMRYLGNYLSPDIGAFEWQPIPVVWPDEKVVTDPAASVTLDVLANDGQSRINALPTIVDTSLSANIGKVTTDGKSIVYTLEEAVRGVLGRDEVRYVAGFGDQQSEPGRATVWLVGRTPGTREFVVNTAHDHEIPPDGVLDFNEGGLTLREALLLASHSEEDDVIRFDEVLFSSQQMIHLVAPLKLDAVAKGSIKIIGPGAELLSLVGPLIPSRGLEIGTSKDRVPSITLSHISFLNCAAASGENGGAVLVSGSSDVRFEYSAFIGNSAADGAALSAKGATGTLSVSQCTFLNNSTSAANSHTVHPETLTVIQSILSGNQNAGAVETETYGTANYRDEPRFVAVAPDIRLRRDSRAFRLGEITGIANKSHPFPLGAYAPRFDGSGNRVATHLPQFETGTPIGNAVIYVDYSVAASGNGDGWAGAYQTLDEGLERAAEDYSVAAIHVAGGANGSYKPSRGYDLPRTPSPAGNTFILQHGLEVRGGYPSMMATASEGTGPDREESNPSLYPTTLEGLLSGNQNDDPIHSSNVFTARDIKLFVAANLTVQHGFAPAPNGGGAILCDGVSAGRLSGLFLKDNQGNNGGAVYLNGGKLDVDGCLFQGNRAVSQDTAAGLGGAVYMTGPNSILAIKNSSLTENSAARGGAIGMAAGILKAQFLTIVRNQATGDGAGGLQVDGGTASPVTQCVLHGNTPDYVRGPALDASNSVKPGWSHSLIAAPKFNRVQGLKVDGATGSIDNKLIQGPTPSMAILPEVDFRIGKPPQSLDGLVDKVDFVAEDSADQRGDGRRPSPKGAKSDLGAFERQYFSLDSVFPRFFFVDDDTATGPHLWAETELLHFVQISQHLQSKMAAVPTSVTATSIDFVSDNSRNHAEQSETGFVFPTTAFPSNEDWIRTISYPAKSPVKLELEKDGMSTKLTIKDGDEATGVTRNWEIVGPGATLTSTDAAFVIPSVAEGRYTVKLVRNGGEMPKISFEIRPRQ